MGACSGLGRLFLGVFTGVLVVLGLAIVALGGYLTYICTQKYAEFMDSPYTYASIVVIVIGLVIFVTAFLGFCGSVRKDHCMLATFGSLMLLIIIAELALVIVCYNYQEQAITFIKNTMLKSTEQYWDKDPVVGDVVMKSWDALQADFQCCGIDDGKSWLKNEPRQIPDSCCKEVPLNCNNKTTDMTSLADPKKDCCAMDYKTYHKRGCFKIFSEWFENNIPIVAGVGIAILVIQVIGIFAGCMLGDNAYGQVLRPAGGQKMV